MRAGRLPNALKKTTWGLSQRMHISAGPERVPPCINTKLYFIFRSTFIIQVRSSTILLRVEKCGARVTVLSSLELKNTRHSKGVCSPFLTQCRLILAQKHTLSERIDYPPGQKMST